MKQDTLHKILSAETGSSVILRCRQQQQTLVVTNGCFDLLHPGHLHLLEFAAAQADVLLVAVNDDESVRRLKGASRPVFPLHVRLRMLAALSCVDYVMAFAEDTPEQLIQQLTPQVLVKGGDYQPDQIVGGEWVRKHGGQVLICPELPGFRTTQLLSR